MYKDFANTEIETALIAIQAGDDTALSDLYTAYAPVLSRIAASLQCQDGPEEALAVVNAAFMEAVRSPLGTSTRSVAGRFYKTIRNLAKDGSTSQSSVQVPLGTIHRYWLIRNKYDVEKGTPADGRPVQSSADAIRDAYEACKRGGEDMTGAAFMATHQALYSHTSRATIGTVDSDAESDAYSRDHNTVDLGSEDNIAALDSYALVHEHLLPLLDPETYQDVIIRLRYGFPQVSDAVADKLENAGYQPGTILSDPVIAEVLHIDGLGYQTVRKRRLAALEIMRTYLDEDARREAAA